MALAPAALRTAADDTARRARLAEGTADGVRLARAAAGLARVRALREHDAHPLDDAERLLAAASRRADLPGACDAALDRARMFALDAGDLRSAWIAAHRIEARFGRVDAARSCVADARRMARTFESARPSDAEVTAIDASDDDDATAVAQDGASGAGQANSASAGPTDPQVEAWAAAHAGAGVAPQLVGVDAPGLVAGATHARIVLRFSAPTAFTRSELPRDGPLPRRLVLDFPRASAIDDVPAVTTLGAGGVVRARVAQTDPRTLRVVLDLDDTARTQLFFLAAPYRVVIDAEHGPRVAHRDQRAPLRLLVLDPGHGGDDHGAPGPGGMRESRVALDLAQRVKAILAERLPDVRVLLTRDRDVFVSLEQRAAIANAAGADAFVLDSPQRVADARGGRRCRHVRPRHHRRPRDAGARRARERHGRGGPR